MRVFDATANRDVGSGSVSTSIPVNGSVNCINDMLALGDRPAERPSGYFLLCPLTEARGPVGGRDI